VPAPRLRQPPCVHLRSRGRCALRRRHDSAGRRAPRIHRFWRR
jgi:hypothetical protein